MATGDSCGCNNTYVTSCNSNGFLIVVVLYILLAIIIGSALFY